MRVPCDFLTGAFDTLLPGACGAKVTRCVQVNGNVEEHHAFVEKRNATFVSAICATTHRLVLMKRPHVLI